MWLNLTKSPHNSRSWSRDQHVCFLLYIMHLNYVMSRLYTRSAAVATQTLYVCMLCVCICLCMYVFVCMYVCMYVYKLSCFVYVFYCMKKLMSTCVLSKTFISNCIYQNILPKWANVISSWYDVTDPQLWCHVWRVLVSMAGWTRVLHPILCCILYSLYDVHTSIEFVNYNTWNFGHELLSLYSMQSGVELGPRGKDCEEARP